MKKILILTITFFSISIYGNRDAQTFDTKLNQPGFLTGDWGGIRTSLKQIGIEPVAKLSIAPGFVLVGGHKQGGTSPFFLKFGILLHSEGYKIWEGGSFYVGAEWKNSFNDQPNLTTHYAGSFQTIHPLDDTNHYFQLSEFWFQQTFFKNRVGIKIGKQYSSHLFLNQKVARNFLNSSFRYIPTVPLTRYKTKDVHFEAFNLSPVRRQIAPSIGVVAWANLFSWLKLTAGISDQRPKESIVLFSEESKARKNYSITTELLFSPMKSENSHIISEYRIGIWYVNKTNFSDIKEEDLHPHAKRFRGTGGPYLTFDQMLFKENSVSKDLQGFSIFGQFGFAPGKWESFLYYGGGLQYEGLFPTRELDKIGIAFGLIDFSEKMEGETDSKTGEFRKTHDMTSFESLLEFFYKLKATNWLSMHNDLQWIRIPKGIKDPNNKYYEKDALVFNMMVDVQF